MKLRLITSALLMASTFSACAMGIAPVSGVIYTEVMGPIAATDENGTKVGTATCQSILGAVALGDCSIQAAKKNGGIATVSTVDYKTRSILGLFAEVTTTVHGR